MIIGNKEFKDYTYVMAIINLTPDSFWKDSRAAADGALFAAGRAVNDGAAVLDIGAQSTRPGYTEIPPEEEISRLERPLRAILREFDIPVSVDTYFASVADFALSEGAHMINDVWGLTRGNMAGVIAKHGGSACIMHNSPSPVVGDVFPPVESFLKAQAQVAVDAGIDPQKIIPDGGIGFAKSREQNLALLQGYSRLKDLGYPLLLACSRKSLFGGRVEDRLPQTLAATRAAAKSGVLFVRVHDVKLNVEEIKKHMKIEISSLEVLTTHGVLPEEKVNPQPFVFDISLEADCEEAALRDDLSKTVNYSQVCALVHNVATARTYNLIEALARECAFSILEKFERVRSVEVKVSKPKAPVKAQFGNISVSYYAERNSVYISLGSSMGDREKTIKAALSKLSAMRGIKLLRTSSMIKTAPVGGVAQNEFVNCAAELDCFLSPRALLDKIHTVEAHLGRVRSRRWDDRPIDIDIIFFGDKVIAEEGLAVPHPHYASRAFVTLPLKELCPEKICPLTHKAIKDM